MTRSPLLLAVLAAGALALAACGSGGGSDPKKASSPQDKAFDSAVKFAQCMREHGVDVPDPQKSSNGLVRMAGPKNANPNDPKLKSANQACQKLLDTGTGGQAPDQATLAKAQDAFVKYAACMRKHGVDMPDPKVGGSGGGVTFQIGGGKTRLNPDSPAFKQADKVCHALLGNVGPGGGGNVEQAP
jgi:hypothetical protein